MDVAGAGNSLAGTTTPYNRFQELKAFDESKAGVKGLVDSGITKLLRFFIRPPEDLAAGDPVSGEPADAQFTILAIDLNGLAVDRSGVVAGVRRAAETMGFFQAVNHEIPVKVLEEAMAAVREFHELPQELKGEYYNRELMKKVKFGSNFDLYQSK
ncbi:hypothetical protein GYH30_025059 [Glycine max]|nr:hypothetical protein GYH30_025059 [Glycine max]